MTCLLSTWARLLRSSASHLPPPPSSSGLACLSSLTILSCLALSSSLPLPLFPFFEATTEECHAGLTRCICLSRALHAAEKEPSSPLCKASRDGWKSGGAGEIGGKAALNLNLLTRMWTRIVQGDDKRRDQRREILDSRPISPTMELWTMKNFLYQEDDTKGREASVNSKSCLER